MFRRYLY